LIISANISIIIPTYNRTDCIRRNLGAIALQDPSVAQVVIVDASPGDETERVVQLAVEAGLPYKVIYRRNPNGRGNTPNSRNKAMLEATGEIIAFLDDDAFPRAGWSTALLESFADPSVAGVAGRAMNGLPHEDLINTDDIGRLRPDGTMSGNFNSNPGRCIDVDHMIGCNCAWRASVLAHLGGQLDDWNLGKQCLMEETETCIRARRLGYRLVFNPDVVADHIGAPQPGGRRFSPKYSYYHTKNNFVMIIRNYGFGLMMLRYPVAIASQSVLGFVRKFAGAGAHSFCTFAGLIAGTCSGLYWLLKTSNDPTRRDEKGEAIRNALAHAAATNTTLPDAVRKLN
jgi:GT2 family glycosyltransferase